MKKNIYTTLIAIFAIIMTLTSCSDFLDANNKSAGGTASDHFNKNVSYLLVSTYNSLKNIVYNPSLYCEGTDLYINTRGKDAGVYNEYTLTPEDNTVSSYYSDVYQTINYANGVLSYTDSTSETGCEARFLRNFGYYLLTQEFGSVPYITKYIDEGSNKNYPKTSLSTIYSSMIKDLTDLYNNSTLPEQNHLGHASKQAVAALLAKTYLANGWDINTTLNDAQEGTYTVKDTKDFISAAAWAEKAIDGISLTMDFDKKWAPENEGNSEEIFSVQYDRASYPGDVSDGGHNMQYNFGGYYGDCTTLGMKTCSSVDAQSEKSMYLFSPGDKRYEGTYMTTMYNATLMANGKTANWGTQGYFAYYNSTKRDTLTIAHRYFPYYITEAEAEKEFETHKNQYRFRKDVDANTVSADILSLPNIVHYTFNADGSVASKVYQDLTTYNNQVNNGVCVKKFDDPNSAQLTKDNDYRDIVVFHVSDMYLVAAEAYLMAGQTTQSLDKVNEVRERAGLSTLNSFTAYQPSYSISSSFHLTPLDVILDERARELYAEGKRWIDLRRTKQLIRYNVEFNPSIGSASQMANKEGEYKWYRPIPENEISSNTGITEKDQNPGY
ncbi:RagB/SusD family nutrient uptake outer membrane protein [Prevotella cerevisiae]|uniref:RagB/SusD family nutrient uptake outer membrane protein n=1 Tax=Segatella cerevisiae TaxID=2053716 RepID=A0ABT1BT86_9BACT|nr:RagB/SusD family nutrient uptake outer membrane protein [Segatella cerevisiae]MCO6024294.1 RagB/SusD family nutrient uptake outer membrane protein [Segatella cerevisiae]